MTHAFNALIVEIDMRDFDVLRQRVGTDCKRDCVMISTPRPDTSFTSNT